MPIEFQPAAPTGVNAAASYGSAQQSAQDMPTTANLYEAQARLTMQQQQLQQAGQEAQQRGNAAATAAQLEDRHQQQAFAGQQDQTALGYATLQQHSADIDRHAQAQAWVNQQDMTYADQLRMNRMQQGVSEVEDAYRNNKIDQDTYTNAIFQIRTGLDPLKMKFEKQQADHLKQQDELTAQRIRDTVAHNQTAKEFEAQMIGQGKGVLTSYDEHGRLQIAVKNDRTGEWYSPFKTSGNAGAAGGRDQQAAYKAEQDATAAWDSAYEKAKALVQKWKTETVKDASGKPTRLHPELDDTDKFHAIVDGQMSRGPYGTSRDAYVRRQAARFQQGGAAGGGSDIGGGGDYGAAPAAGQPASPPPAPGPTPEQVEARRQQVVREQPPITDPEKATDRQKETLDLLGKKKAAVDTIRLPGDENDQAKRAIGEVEDLYRRFGSLEGMPPPARQHVAAVMQMIDRLDQQMAAGQAAKKKFVADQGTRFDRGLKRIGDALDSAHMEKD